MHDVLLTSTSTSAPVADALASAHPDPHSADPVHADDLDLVERLVVAPVAGVFFPAFTDVSAASPGMVAIGDEIGVMVQSGEKHPVASPFTGELLGMLAQPGERLRRYQPIAWLTIGRQGVIRTGLPMPPDSDAVRFTSPDRRVSQ